jgi:hypothetical protein
LWGEFMQGEKPMEKRNFQISYRQASIFLVAAVLYFALLCLFPVALVHGAGTAAGFAAKGLEGGAQIAALALAGLAGAQVTPQFALCAASAAVCAILLTARRSLQSAAVRRSLAVLAALVTIAGLALSAWRCKINGVPLGTFAAILSDLLKSGIL